MFFKGLTPLHLCIIDNHTDCIQKLLDSNANINARTHNGSLPIHFAVYVGNTDIFDLLNNQSKAPELIETDQHGNVCIHLERKRHPQFVFFKDYSSFCCCNKIYRIEYHSTFIIPTKNSIIS